MVAGVLGVSQVRTSYNVIGDVVNKYRPANRSLTRKHGVVILISADVRPALTRGSNCVSCRQNAAGAPSETLSEMTEPQQDRVFVALAERILEIIDGTS